jgi:hypothetical protein
MSSINQRQPCTEEFSQFLTAQVALLDARLYQCESVKLLEFNLMSPRRVTWFRFVKTIVFSLVMLSTTVAFPQEINMANFRAKIPQLHGLDDSSAVRLIQRVYYPDVSVENIAEKLGVVMETPFVPKALGPIDKWRYESCQQDAATAPTQSGVNIKMRVCREKFGQ